MTADLTEVVEWSEADALDGWYVVARTHELSAKKPVRRWVNGMPIALYLEQGEVRALVDRCPHRGAPLSQGRIRDGRIECPYHGWQFNGAGELCAMPCLTDAPPKVSAKTLKVSVKRGLVFVGIGETSEGPYLNEGFSEVSFWRAVKGRVTAPLPDALENFLDPTHTIFVHHQLVRSVKNNNRTTVEVTTNEDGLVASYFGEGQAGGVVSKIMNEKDRALSIGRFVAPNVAEVEFHGPKCVNFVMTGYMTPTRDGQVEGYGLVGLPGPRWWAWIKFWVLYPWIKLVHAQDKSILEAVADNDAAFNSRRKRIGPLDVVRPLIDAFLRGKPPPPGQTRRTEMDL